MAAKKEEAAAKKPAKRGSAPEFNADELAAVKEWAAEAKAKARRGSGAKAKGEEEAEVLEKIAAMSEPDRGMAKRLHAIVTAAAPALSPRTWYGMPAYARDGKVVCFFQNASKFKTRYSTFGFSDSAYLDDGDLWPVTFALKELTPAVEARIVDLVKKAAG